MFQVKEDCLVVAVKDQVSCQLGDEVVIMTLTEGTYYGLNPVGSRVWNLIQQPKTLAELRDLLMEEYAVERESCELDLQDLIEDLEKNGLIEIKTPVSAAGNGVSA